MKESHRKGVANHPDPESCRTHREVRLEAFDRGTCGLSIELRKRLEWSADAVRLSGRQQGRGRRRENPDSSAESETSCTYGNSVYGNQEIPAAPQTGEGGGRKGNPQGQALYARRWEVGRPHSTEEGPEQTPQGGRRGWREGGR